MSRALAFLSEQEDNWNLLADVTVSTTETAVRFLPAWLKRENKLGADSEKKISIWLGI